TRMKFTKSSLNKRISSWRTKDPIANLEPLLPLSRAPPKAEMWPLRGAFYSFKRNKIVPNAEPPQHIKKQNGIIRDLKEKVDAADSAIADANTKSKEEEFTESDKKRRAELEILERENKMIVSAWYDQATRLQMNSVALERKGDTPHSWLNKQRAALAKAGGV
ncbi:hypothetical protein C7212DRAFT_320109, partial [Tuber magnatum]